MKKWIALLMTLVMVFSFAACGAAAADSKTVSGTLPEFDSTLKTGNIKER